MIRILLLISLLGSLTSCSSVFRRHQAINLQDRSESNDWYLYQEQDVQASMQELSINNSRALNPSERLRLSYRLAVKEKEKSLQTETERLQYYRYRPYMGNDRQRLQFLRLPGYGQKQAWLKRRGLLNPRFNNTISTAIEGQDIILNMPMKAVEKSWGEPDFKEIAGNPIYGNQRWRYVDFRSSPSGFRKQEKVVYFEQGLVSAWQTR